MKFQELLKIARKRKKLTQRKVAEGVGISINHYQQYEYTDRIPSGEYMIKLINFLDLGIKDVEKSLESN